MTAQEIVGVGAVALILFLFAVIAITLLKKAK